MKKIAIALIAVIYMGISSGIAMEIHYCMGKKAGVEFYGNKEDKCGKCGMKDNKDCCSDEHKFIKLTDSHKNVASDQPGKAISVNLVPLGVPLITTGYAVKPVQESFNGISPPPRFTGIDACRMNCLFRI